MSTLQCVICEVPDAGDIGWTDWELHTPIQWRGAFTSAAEPLVPAGPRRACPACSAWIPDGRAGRMPTAVRQGIHEAVWCQPLHPTTRRQLHAELVGRLRHLAVQLRPRRGDDEGQADR